jgi:hypothetical protein
VLSLFMETIAAANTSVLTGSQPSVPARAKLAPNAFGDRQACNCQAGDSTTGASSFAGAALAGAELRTVAQLLGHQTIQLLPARRIRLPIRRTARSSRLWAPHPQPGREQRRAAAG